MEKDVIILRDVNGQQVIISNEEIVSKIFNKEFMFMGLTGKNIKDLRHEYDNRQGTYPPTTESIKKAFGHESQILENIVSSMIVMPDNKDYGYFKVGDTVIICNEQTGFNEEYGTIIKRHDSSLTFTVEIRR